MNKSLLSILQNQFLNKRITVVVPDRDNNGKVILNRTVQCTGFCMFIGSNNLLLWDIQVTIDGMPVHVRHINDIVITPERKTIRN